MRFTKASRTDATKVTVNVNELYEFLQTTALTPLAVAKMMAYTRIKGHAVILTINNVDTLFYVNRVGKTLCTNAFPPKLTRPSVGRPVNYTVTHMANILSTSHSVGGRGY